MEPSRTLECVPGSQTRVNHAYLTFFQIKSAASGTPRCLTNLIWQQLVSVVFTVLTRTFEV